MDPAEFHALALAIRDECVASTAPTAVHDAAARLLPAIDGGPAVQEVLYRVLRGIVDHAATSGDRSYSKLVALHDLLLRNGAFRPPLRDPAPLLYFDEAFYLELHPDVAAAVRAGHLADGFAHFVHSGAAEGRTAHPWRPALRLAPPEPARSAALSLAASGGERRLDPGDAGPGPTIAAASRAPTDKVRHPLGINLIGFHSANLGLGVSARHYFRFLVESGLDVRPIDVPLPGNRSGHDLSYAEQFLPLDVPPTHAVNLFLMNPRDITDVLARRYPAVQTAG